MSLRFVEQEHWPKQRSLHDVNATELPTFSPTNSPTNSTNSTEDYATSTDTEIIKETFRVYGSMYLFIFLLFSFLRIKYPRLFNLRSWVPEFSSELAMKQNYGFVSWCWQVYYVSDDDLLDACGMDALCFTRALRLGAKLSLVGTANAVWLIPVYLTAKESIETEYLTYSFEQMSIANLPSKSSRFVGSVFAAYVIILFSMYLVSKEYAWYTDFRHKYLSKRVPQNYAIYVSGIPSKYRSSYALADYFQRISSQGVVLEAHITVDIPLLEAKVARRVKVLAKLEHAIAKERKKGDTQTHMTFKFQDGVKSVKKVASVKAFRTELNRLNQEIALWRSKVANSNDRMRHRRQRVSGTTDVSVLDSLSPIGEGESPPRNKFSETETGIEVPGQDMPLLGPPAGITMQGRTNSDEQTKTSQMSPLTILDGSPSYDQEFPDSDPDLSDFPELDLTGWINQLSPIGEADDTPRSQKSSFQFEETNKTCETSFELIEAKTTGSSQNNDTLPFEIRTNPDDHVGVFGSNTSDRRGSHGFDESGPTFMDYKAHLNASLDWSTKTPTTEDMQSAPTTPTREKKGHRRKVSWGDTHRSPGFNRVRAASLEGVKRVGSGTKKVGTVVKKALKEVNMDTKESLKKVGSIAGRSVSSAGSFGVSSVKQAVNFGIQNAAAVVPVLMSKENGRPRDAGFVAFDNLYATHAARQMLQHKVANKMLVEPAPNPIEIFWRNVGLPSRGRNTGKVLSILATSTLCFFWSIPSAFLSSLTEVNALKEKLPGLGRLVEKYPMVESFLALIAPLFLLLLNECILPHVLRWFATWEGHISISLLEASLFVKLCSFTIIQSFFVSAVSGTVTAELTNIIENPDEIMNILANSLPAQSSYFIQICFVFTFLLQGFDLLRVQELTLAFFRHYVFGPRLTAKERSNTWRCFRSLEDPRPFWHPEVFSQIMLFFVVFFVYSVIAPITSVFLGGCFLICESGYRYNFIHNHQPTPDSGGKLWQSFIQVLLASMLIGEITLVGLLLLKKASFAVPALLPLIAVTILYMIFIIPKCNLAATYLPAMLCVDLDEESQNREAADVSSFITKKYLQPALKAKPEYPEEVGYEV